MNLPHKETTFVLSNADVFYEDRIIVEVSYVPVSNQSHLPLLLRTKRLPDTVLRFYHLNKENRLMDLVLEPSLVDSVKREFEKSFLFGERRFSIQFI